MENQAKQMSKMFSAWIEGKPTAQGSKKAFVINGKAVLVESAAGNKTWRKTVTQAIKANRSYRQFEGAVNMSLVFYMPKAASNKTQQMTQKPDIDKLCRSVLDAASDSQLIQDDSRIVHLTATKKWAEDGRPGVMILCWASDDTPTT